MEARVREEEKDEKEKGVGGLHHLSGCSQPGPSKSRARGVEPVGRLQR